LFGKLDSPIGSDTLITHYEPIVGLWSKRPGLFSWEGLAMSRNVKLALLLSLVSCGVAAAQPQVVSYFTGSCPVSGSCNVVATLPVQGFVLTDIIYGESTFGDLLIQEVSGQTIVDKVEVRLGDINNFENLSYHFESGVAFAGGSAIRALASSVHLNRLTIMGYIPGTAASGNVPAVGTLGLAILVIGMVAAGGLVLRRASLRQSATL
jgi:hypothetical protein